MMGPFVTNLLLKSNRSLFLHPETRHIILMSEITPEQIGEIIKQLRKERNLTQTELGEKMGVKKSSIALYEKGRDNISLSTLKRIASALNAELTINITLK